MRDTEGDVDADAEGDVDADAEATGALAEGDALIPLATS